MREEETADSPIVGEAATVVLMRDGVDGLEVLLLERPHSGSFAGAWVFPGGRVDPEDALAADDGARPAWAGVPPEQGAALGRAAVRETFEETGIILAPSELTPLSHWVPPLGAPKRLRTWFFLAAHPGGGVVLNEGEHVGSEWMTPKEALERHGAGAVVLAPPTWVTLNGLLPHGSVGEVLAQASAGSRGFEYYFSHPLRGDGGVDAVMWAGDAQYEDPRAEGPARHRLWIASLPWRFERTL